MSAQLDSEHVPQILEARCYRARELARQTDRDRRPRCFFSTALFILHSDSTREFAHIQTSSVHCVPANHSHLRTGQKLLYCVENYGVIIMVGQTGCGKTTRKFGVIRAKDYPHKEPRTSAIFNGGWLGLRRSCHCLHPAKESCCNICRVACRSRGGHNSRRRSELHIEPKDSSLSLFRLVMLFALKMSATKNGLAFST